MDFVLTTYCVTTTHYAWMKGKSVPMEEARQRWGV